MKIERTKNATRSMIFGWLLNIYQLIMPFIMRTIMIYFLGVNYLGLNGLFTSILSVLNLAELGVGSAMVYSMYRPIAEDNTEKICALMNLYRKYYHIIGLVILSVGVVLLPFIPSLISGEIPSDINIYILYLINLGATVFSYWLFAYKNCLFTAHQRGDITSKITLAVSTVQYVAQFLAIILLHSYYVYITLTLIMQIINNFVTAKVADKIYPEYKPCGILSRKEISTINHRVRDLFTSKIGSVVVNSADTIVISAFLGLQMLAIYQNYFYILTSVKAIVGVALGACQAGIGNSLVVETKKKNMNDLKRLTFILVWISGFCTCCFLALYQPFMQIWVGTDLMLGYGAVICFAVYFFVIEINTLLNIYKDAGGLWHEDKWRPLTTALTNLIMNLIMVQFWGIYGILLSTVLSTLIVGMPWLLHNLFTVLFEKKDLKPYLKHLLYYTMISALTCIITLFICNLVTLSDWSTIIFRGIICIIVPNLLFFIIYYKSEEFFDMLQLINSITKGKIKLLGILANKRGNMK